MESRGCGYCIESRARLEEKERKSICKPGDVDIERIRIVREDRRDSRLNRTVEGPMSDILTEFEDGKYYYYIDGILEEEGVQDVIVRFTDAILHFMPMIKP